MSLTGREIELLLEEIAPFTVSGALQKVFEADPDHLVLQIRVPGKTHFLLLGLQPGHGRLHFVDNKPRQPAQPTHFTMLLRKWIQGALIESVEQIQRDRIVRFNLSRIDPDWEREPAPSSPEEFDSDASPRSHPPRTSLALIIELTGQQPNAFVLDNKDRILGRRRNSVVGGRELSTGATYLPPPPPPLAPEARENIRWELDRLAPGERSQRVNEHLGSQRDEDRVEFLRMNLTTGLQRKLRALKKRLRNIEGDLEKIERADDYRRYGELLQGAYGQVKKGATRARVPDYYAEGIPEVDIPLDPAKSLKENIERYFHQYRRFKNAREKVETRMLQTLEDIDQIEELLRRLEDLPDEIETLERFAASADVRRHIRKKQRPSSGPTSRTRALPYREFLSRSGTSILVGRGSKHNDALSTHIARGRDLWLHARDWAGAHVVLRMDKGTDPKSEDLLDAATLAAHFSRGREDTLIDVTYTLAKHVRKPKGMPPGLVTVAGGPTLTVRIDPGRLERLLESEKSE